MSAPMSKMDFAFNAADRGFVPFPLGPNSDEPAFPQGDAMATRNKTLLRHWWEEDPRCNIGISLENLLTLRLTKRCPLETVEQLALLFKEHDAPKSVCPRRTRPDDEAIELCLHFSLPDGAAVEAKSDVFFAGIDLLSTDDFVVGPGSVLHHHMCTFVDDKRPETWEKALRPETRMFLVETITNPLMRVPRLADVVEFARRKRIMTVIDNTFASPVNFRPLSVGFDLLFHSATKYLNGHSDLVAGCVMGSAEKVERVRRTLNLLGGSLDPHAGFLLARGSKTLALRVKAQNANGLAVARLLQTHTAVREVNYPGLETHPDHAHARPLLSGFGGMLSLRLKSGTEGAKRLIAALRIPYHAPSLGGVETLITQPALSSHAGMKREDRERLGVTDDLLRVSCGIESAEDLVDDFRQALDRV